MMNTVERIMALREHYDLPRRTYDEVYDVSKARPLHYQMSQLDAVTGINTTGGIRLGAPQNLLGARVSMHERHAGAGYWRGKPSLMMWLGSDGAPEQEEMDV